MPRIWFKSCEIRLGILLGAVLISQLAAAAVPQKPLQKVLENNIVRGSGVIRGGNASIYFSVLDVRRTASSKVERLVIDLGDATLKPFAGKPAYFSIEVKERPQRFVVDLAQTLNAKVDDKLLAKVVKNSNLLKSARMNFEPASQTMSLSFDLKRPINLRAIPVEGQKNSTAKLVLDISEKR